MSEPLNKRLYKYVKKLADKKFKLKSGIYKSSWIVREYKKRGGTYKGEKNYKFGILRWFKENWVDLNRPIKNTKGKIIGYEQCGRLKISSSKKYPFCRPSRKVSSKTPRTYKEISKKSILKAKKEKSKVKGSRNIKIGGGRHPSMHKCKYCDQKQLGKKELKTHIEEEHIFYTKINTANEKYNKELPNKEQSQKMDDIHFKNIKKYIKEIQDGGKSQYYGKRSSIMVKVPKNVKKWAQYAFKLKELGFEGAVETGWKRAKQLSTKEYIPIEDLRYMRNWYARHIYTSYPTFREWIDAGRPKTKEWHNKRGILAWITWGADAGLKWVNSEKTLKLLNKHFNKNYKLIKIKK